MPDMNADQKETISNLLHSYKIRMVEVVKGQPDAILVLDKKVKIIIDYNGEIQDLSLEG